MNDTVGVITSFYGYRGNLIEKIENLVRVFDSIDIQPYIQIHSQPQKLSFDDLVRKLNNLKEEYNIIFSIHQSMFIPNDKFYLNLGSSDEYIWGKSVKACKRSIDLARKIDAKFFSFHAGYAANKASQKNEMETVTIDGKISFQEAYSNFRRGLNDILDYTQGDIEVSVENLVYRPHKRYLFSRSEDFRYLSDRAKILFDVGHAYFSKKTLNDNRYIDRIIEERRVSEIHISDNDGSMDAHHLIGYGTIPFVEIFKHLIRLQKLPPVIVEAVKNKYNYTDKNLADCLMILKNKLQEVKDWEFKGRDY